MSTPVVQGSLPPVGGDEQGPANETGGWTRVSIGVRQHIRTTTATTAS